MTRRTLFQLPFANQTRISVDQIASSLVIVSEELHPGTDGTLTLTFPPGNNFIQLFINGVQTRPERDFTIVGKVITLIPYYNSILANPESKFDAYYYR